MIQIATEQMKAISDRQMDAIKQIIQNRNFTLGEYKKLKEVLGRRVITRRDASAFLDYCYAKVFFERYFNGHKHKAYAGCCFCRSRDNLRRVENRKTGRRGWCCEACRSKLAGGDVIELAKGRGGKPKVLSKEHRGAQAAEGGLARGDAGQMVERMQRAGYFIGCGSAE